MKNKLIRKFFSFSYGGFVGAGIGFLTTMITTRVLQPEEFGKASMFTLFISISMIFIIFGTDQAFVRFYYEEEEKKRGALLYSCLKIVSCIIIPTIFIFFLFGEQISIMLFDEHSWMIVAFIAIGIVIQVFYRFATLVIRMQQKGNFFSIIQILNGTFILIGVIAFYFILGSTFKILVFSNVVSFTMLLILLIISQKDFWKTDNFKLDKLKHTKSDIIKFSYPLVLTTMIIWVFEGFDKIALRYWTDFNEVGLYSAAFKIVALLTILKVAFTTFWTPLAYETFEKDPDNKEFYSRVSKYVSFLMMFMAIIVIMFKDVILMLLGSEYQEASHMLSFLVFIPVMYTISETTVLGINFFKKVKWHIVIAVIACLVNILGNWLLVPSYGGVGAAVATGISYILFFTLRTLISLKYYKVDYGLYKVYFSICVVFIFASFTLLEPEQWIQFSVGGAALLLISVIYREQILSIFKILSNRKL